MEHKDRATRFEFHYIETLLEKQGRQIEVVNLAENGNEDLMTDLVSIIDSFSVRLYGYCKAKRKIEQVIQALTSEESECSQDAISGATPD